MVALKVEK
jgi:hypothetical protein